MGKKSAIISCVIGMAQTEGECESFSEKTLAGMIASAYDRVVGNDRYSKCEDCSNFECKKEVVYELFGRQNETYNISPCDFCSIKNNGRYCLFSKLPD